MATLFISHRGSDTPVAKQLARDLRALGYTVWIDVDEVRVGDSIIARMGQGLRDADFLLMLFSEDQSDCPWMDREWMSFLARQLEHEGVRILPVKHGTAVGPAILRDIKCADLSRDWNRGVEELVSSIRGR